MTSVVRLPVPIATDRLRGLIDRTDGPMDQLTVALVAIHALGKLEIPHLFLADLDLPRGCLLVRRPLSLHTVYLDGLTRALAVDWLRERHRRWPVTANPHLLVSQQTADMDTCPPVSKMVMNDIFRPLGLTPSGLRQDRILDEARHTADPVHLMRVCGRARGDPAAPGRVCRDPRHRAGDFMTLRESEVLCTQRRKPHVSHADDFGH